MSDRDGFLTSTDRAWLRGEKEYTGEHAKQQRYQRRRAIRERTRRAVHDFALLHRTLDPGDEELGKIFDTDTDSKLRFDIDATLALLHRVFGDSEFRERVERGVEKSLRRADGSIVMADVDVSLHYETATDTGERQNVSNFKLEMRDDEELAADLVNNTELYLDAFEHVPDEVRETYRDALTE